MKATLKLEDGREIQVELSEKDVDAIVKPKKTGWERVEPGQCYCYITGGGFVPPEKEKQNESDTFYYNNANYFADRDLANDQARAISLWLRIKRWAAEHCEPVDWKSRSEKYSFYWDHMEKRVCVSGISIVYRMAFAVYFDTPDHADQCIEEFKNELTWYFTECKDRMDG